MNKLKLKIQLKKGLYYSNTSVLRYISCIGDSLSSGELQITLDEKNKKYRFIDKLEYSWGQFLARKNSITVYNMSRGGMFAKEYVESFADNNDFWNPKYKSQAYIIALGYNDLKYANNNFGDLNDIDKLDESNNKNTFLGYYARIIQKYKKISPNAKFFLMSMPKEYNDSKQFRQIKIKHRHLLLSLCNEFDNCYLLDFYKYVPTYNKKFKQKYFLNGHLNEFGYKYTAKIVDILIHNIIEENRNNFVLVGNSDLFKDSFFFEN